MDWIYRIPKFVSSIAVVLVVLYLTLFPDPFSGTKVPMFPGADKVVHFVMFFSVAACFYLDFGRTNMFSGKLKLGLFCFFIALVLGGFIEIMQFAMNLGRSGDVVDWAADAVGALIGIALSRFYMFKGK